jgi:hypothetical protein
MAEYIYTELCNCLTSIINWGDAAAPPVVTGDLLLANATDQVLINATDVVQI